MIAATSGVLAEIDRQAFYLPIIVAVGAVVLRLVWQRLCRWADGFPHLDETERAVQEWSRVGAALDRTEKVQKERTR